MKVSVNDVSGCTKEVQVEVPAETVQAKIDHIYQRISQEAKLPGFRKGKAPLEVIKKQYRSTAREEIVHHELPEFFRTVLIDQKIDPVAQPQITHLQYEEGSPLKFVARVEIKPTFLLKDYKGLKVKKEKVEVKEEEVDKALDGLREQLAQFVPVEDRPVKQDDLVIIDFQGMIDGKPFEGGKADRYPVLLGSANMLKDFEAALVGIPKDGSKTFKLTFPADYGKKEVAGKEAEFTVTVHEIKEKKLPAVDNDFAKEVGKSETVKELRDKLESQIRSGKENEQRSKMIDQVGQKLLAEHSFDVPASLVNQEHQRLVRQGVDRLKGQGIDANRLTDEQKKEFVEKLRPMADKNVRMALIVERIAEAEKIRCEDSDFEAYIERLAKNANQPADAVRRYVQKQGDPQAIREWIQYEKTLDFLVAQSKIEAA